ncbi:AraC family transcriptional regulator [Rhizobium sp. PP-F2F-G48]|uniref:AraC family transcriptional regulator n=1 Tax=Rhizobium sp. PP-F2F-G48 TaxID=2135651 RepID=UPI00104D6CB6|nr:helix-turn-helix domain-containing protein [Rhizobium sp. PP-F2F-G48]TCM52588.1 AraC family transcriptional regulator [Rhizobium sp. PP-F2F-G48]
MSQHPFTLQRGFKQRGMGMPTHFHDDAQLTFAASGMVQVHTDDGRWLVPPQLAAWIPAGVLHRVEVLTDAELWMVHWQPSVAKDWAPQTELDRPFTLRVTPLMHSLLTTAFSGDITPEKAELVARLMLHELTGTAHAPTFLPLPTSPVGRRVADLAFEDRQNRLNVDELASRAATSVRTMSRLFPAETGMTFKSWRQRARIVQAMDWLARGNAIARVSVEFGFSSTASFSSAFRQVTAMTPTMFLGHPI